MVYDSTNLVRLRDKVSIAGIVLMTATKPKDRGKH
jgi:hypothetical protein